MLKRLALAGLFASLTMLGSCATNSSGQVTVGGQTIQQIETLVAKDVLVACSFVPTATTIAQVVTTALASGVPGLSVAVSDIVTIAANIAGTVNPPIGVCGALATTPTTPPPSARALKAGAPAPTYCIGGQCVPIAGRYVH